MKKNILIVGPKGSGKTTKALEIASLFDKNEVALIINGENHLTDQFNPLLHKDTKLIIYEEVVDIDNVKELLSIISIKTEKKYQNPVIIQPKIIVIYQTPEDYIFEKHWHDRYEIIKCNYKS